MFSLYWKAIELNDKDLVEEILKFGTISSSHSDILLTVAQYSDLEMMKLIVKNIENLKKGDYNILRAELIAHDKNKKDIDKYLISLRNTFWR